MEGRRPAEAFLHEPEQPNESHNREHVRHEPFACQVNGDEGLMLAPPASDHLSPRQSRRVALANSVPDGTLNGGRTSPSVGALPRGRQQLTSRGGETSLPAPTPIGTVAFPSNHKTSITSRPRLAALSAAVQRYDGDVARRAAGDRPELPRAPPRVLLPLRRPARC